MTDRKLGTFVGVFTPTILTILGVIMYLRIGWLVGNLGLAKVIPIVLLANAITLITTLSFSAVATNSQIGAGGAYYIISRSLGIEIGGAIGLPLFLSQVFSVTLYSFGLAESFRIIWPGLELLPATIVTILAVGGLAFLGAEKALKAQIPFLLLVGLSIAALAIGVLRSVEVVAIPLGRGSGDLGFWAGFAIFFPAVTGVMAGLGLSGDLKNPSRSLPRGSLAAVLVGLVIYLLIPIFLAAGVDPQRLRDNPLVWTEVSFLGPYLILPGLWAAIFSSAIGSILAAPRTLQAMARDGLAPRFLARRRSGQGDLVPSLLISLAIALGAVFLGDLNAVATVVTIFFLTVYGTVNFVAAFEALSGDPSWRPDLRTPWVLNLLGGVACLAVMLQMNPLIGIAALVAEVGLYLAISRRERKAAWGDARRGLFESLIRWALVRLMQHPVTARSWRPYILVFVEDIRQELDLVRFGDWFTQGRGLVTVCKLSVGDDLSVASGFEEQRLGMQSFLLSEGVVAFPEVDFVRNLVDGIVDVAQANGMAGIDSNTVLLGWPEDEGLQVEFLMAMRRLASFNKSTLFARVRPQRLYRRSGTERIIVLWWDSLQRNGDLMLLLVFLLTRNAEWRRAKVKILNVATSELMKAKNERVLRALVADIRIRAEVRVLLRSPEEKIAEIIRRESAEAELVLLGIGNVVAGAEADYARRLEALAGDLDSVVFVKNASLFVGELMMNEQETQEPAETPEPAESARSGSEAPPR